MADSFASHVTLSTQEALFLQTLFRGVAGSRVLQAELADVCHVPLDTLNQECDSIAEKIKNSLFVPTTAKIAEKS